MTATRTVVDVPVYEKYTLAVMHQGVTKYAVPWVAGMVGADILEALITATLPAETMAMQAGETLVIAIPGDDASAWAVIIETVLAAVLALL